MLLFLTLQTSILDLTRKLVDVTYAVGANCKEKLNDIFADIFTNIDFSRNKALKQSYCKL